MLWLVFQEPEKCVVSVPSTPKPPELSQKEKNRLAREAWRLKRQVWVRSNNFCPLNSFFKTTSSVSNELWFVVSQREATYLEGGNWDDFIALIILRFSKGLRLQIIFTKPNEKEPFWDNGHHPNPYIFWGFDRVKMTTKSHCVVT